MTISLTLHGQTLTFEGEITFAQLMEMLRLFVNAVESPDAALVIEELTQKIHGNTARLQEVVNGSQS